MTGVQTCALPIYIEIQAREILALRARLNQMYVEHTGQTLKAIEKAMDRDNFMNSEEAKAFGLIDTVVKERPKLDKGEGTTTPEKSATP